MPNTTSRRTSPLPRDWHNIRRRILTRDQYQCTATLADGTRCPSKANQVDHIGDRNSHEDHNLQALCAWHHNKKTAQQASQAANTNKPSRTRTPEPHPGDLP